MWNFRHIREDMEFSRVDFINPRISNIPRTKPYKVGPSNDVRWSIGHSTISTWAPLRSGIPQQVLLHLRPHAFALGFAAALNFTQLGDGRLVSWVG